MIYFWTDVTVRAEGGVWRTAECEHCHQRFHHWYHASAVGSGHAPFMLFKRSATDAATRRARRKLERVLAKDELPPQCPCPWCFGYQAWAAREMARVRYRWLWWAAVIVWGIAPVWWCVVAGIAYEGFGLDKEDERTRLLVGVQAATASVLPGLAVYHRYRRLTAAYDPNDAVSYEDRAMQSRRFAVKDDGVPKLLNPEAPPRLRT